VDKGCALDVKSPGDWPNFVEPGVEWMVQKSRLLHIPTRPMCKSEYGKWIRIVSFTRQIRAELGHFKRESDAYPRMHIHY